jgi:hypothetical protein
VTPSFENQLAWQPTTVMYVDFSTKAREVTSYAVVLAVEHEGELRTVRIYDAAHGLNEIHRYTLTGGKTPGEPFHAGSLGEGMRAAIDEVRRNYAEIIEGWRR